ncbi:tetratricopeptide repeat protein [Nitrincola iocasae]|uniref:Tetratricopeptide repeat protein n=1 Tax=Nitrincola iocasae TaxID=2614693 RepID=A0A5J6LFS4_9GAMM|nr:tetratricopeptide repeat protein [Nitrincola iocasae]QEW07385.1 tetratricopeptide repeat protein [Nitrincola iocasae]
MTLTSPPSLYNQSLQSDDEFVTNFVARREVLETLSRRLEVNGAKSDGQHQILIGTRGMGKTSLLRRLAIEINRSTELSSRFIPLMFREEQYNVLCLRDFWKNCGESLAEWAEAHGNVKLAAQLDDALCSDAWADDEGAADQFLAEMNALGKRAVLMVDNLDLIVDALNDTDRWTLRSSLQLRDGPIIIGAATQSLRESADRNAAFYEFFQPSYLEPLSLPETERCMRALALGRGECGKRVVSILNSDPARLKVLHRLTGGNPRVLALTYRFLETTDTNDAMGDLEKLLDEVTPYYKARIEEYQTPLQRATIDAIALHWDPVTTGQLSKITGLPSTTLSPQLIRLRKDGLIEITETSGSYSGHQVTERFLNIWYLMRHGTRRNKQRMRWLVAFLSSFYSSNDLDALDREARATGLVKSWTKDYADAFEQARQRTVFGQNESSSLAMRRSAKIGQDGEEVTALIKEAWAMFNEAVSLNQSSDTVAEIETYDAIIERFSDSNLPEVQELIAKAMFNKSVTLGQIGDTAAEIETYDALIARFDDSNLPEMRELIAKAMFNKGALLSQNGDTAAEIATYDALIERFGDSNSPEVLEQVTKAMFNKGIFLDQRGDTTAAIETYDTLIARFGDSSSTILQEQAAKAMVNKGVFLGHSGDTTAEIATYDALIACFGDSSSPILQEMVVKAIVYKDIALCQNGDTAAEIETYDAIIERFGDSNLPEVQELIAKAMFNKSVTLGQIGDTAAEIETYDALIERFDDSNLPEMRELIAKAMFNKGVTLGQRGDMAAIETYGQALALMQSLDTDSSKREGSNIAIRLGNVLFDRGIDKERSEALFLQAAEHNPLSAYANLFWLYISTGRVDEAKQALHRLDKLPLKERVLIDSALAFAAENFGEATGHMQAALTEDLTDGDFNFTDDIERLIRLAIAKGFGERLIAWFEKTRLAERYAPVYVALRAAVRGEKMLLDSNPEVRQTASEIYLRLIGGNSSKKGRKP